MRKIACASGNPVKFGIGKELLTKYGVELVQKAVSIDEIQGEDPELVLRDKAEKAFALLQEPVIVTDDWWDFPALGGFPGPYMKSLNHWLTAEDFIAFLAHKKDKRANILQYIGYYDGTTFKMFTGILHGSISDKPAGKTPPASQQVVCLEGDDGLTISEVYDLGKQNDPRRVERWGDAWAGLGTYLQKEQL